MRATPDSEQTVTESPVDVFASDPSEPIVIVQESRKKWHISLALTFALIISLTYIAYVELLERPKLPSTAGSGNQPTGPQYPAHPASEPIAVEEVRLRRVVAPVTIGTGDQGGAEEILSESQKPEEVTSELRPTPHVSKASEPDQEIPFQLPTVARIERVIESIVEESIVQESTTEVSIVEESIVDQSNKPGFEGAVTEEEAAPVILGFRDDASLESPQDEAALRAEELKSDPESKRLHYVQIRREVERQRVEFLRNASIIVRRNGLNSGPGLRTLATQYDHELPPELEAHVSQRNSHYAAMNWEPERWIKMMRWLGVPEPRIFETMRVRFEQSIGIRKGPRDRGEACVFAARELLNVPIPDPHQQGHLSDGRPSD